METTCWKEVMWALNEPLERSLHIRSSCFTEAMVHSEDFSNGQEILLYLGHRG